MCLLTPAGSGSGSSHTQITTEMSLIRISMWMKMSLTVNDGNVSHEKIYGMQWMEMSLTTYERHLHVQL